jgi:hypothetical protein
MALRAGDKFRVLDSYFEPFYRGKIYIAARVSNNRNGSICGYGRSSEETTEDVLLTFPIQNVEAVMVSLCVCVALLQHGHIKYAASVMRATNDYSRIKGKDKFK